MLVDKGQSRAGWHRVKNLLVCPHLAAPTTLHPDSDVLWEDKENIEFLEAQVMQLEKRHGWVRPEKTAFTRGTLIHVAMAQHFQRQLASQQGEDVDQYCEPVRAVQIRGEKLNAPSDVISQVCDYYRWWVQSDSSLFTRTWEVLGVEKQLGVRIPDERYWYQSAPNDLAGYIWPYGIRKRRPMLSVHGHVRILYTQRADLIVRINGQVYFPDWKSTSMRLGAMPGSYAVDGQFIGYKLLGQLRYGAASAGPLVCMMGMGKKFDFKVHEWRTKMLAGPESFWDNIRDAEKRFYSYAEAGTWPHVYNSLACYHKYGQCDKWSSCFT